MTQEEILGKFADSVSDVLEEIKQKMNTLEATNDNDDRTKTFYTQKILRQWFRTNGGLG